MLGGNLAHHSSLNVTNEGYLELPASIAYVLINNNVCVSQGAYLLTGNHDYKKITFDLLPGEIVLEEGVWIGAQSIVCPGITCKSHSILSAGAVATRHLDAYFIYSGNPAVKVRERVFEK